MSKSGTATSMPVVVVTSLVMSFSTFLFAALGVRGMAGPLTADAPGWVRWVVGIFGWIENLLREVTSSPLIALLVAAGVAAAAALLLLGSAGRGGGQAVRLILVDLAGALLNGVGVGITLFAMVYAANHHWAGWLVVGAAILGLVASGILNTIGGALREESR